MFELHHQLQADTVFIADLPLNRVLLAKDSNYPWAILVPRRAGVKEIFELSEPDHQQLWRESTEFSRAMAEYFKANKMNIAALGNMVPQLHIHHVVRYRTDAAWPGPIWGAVPPQAYQPNALAERVDILKTLVAELNF